MDKLISLCKRRGFIYQGSEIYGGLNGTWDYGPLGVELKRNIQQAWWKSMVGSHANIVGLDAAILMHPTVWKASGHVDNFSDPMVDCKACKQRFRADKIDPSAIANKKCPNCEGELTDPRQFNLMFKTHMGPVADADDSAVYLRPETAQGIFVNFKNVVDTTRQSVPFGIAQVGKAFRNEITTKNFIFRTAEFEQMEMQYFVKPGTDLAELEAWKTKRLNYYHQNLGILPENLRFHQHGKDELAHYAVDAYDIEYHYPFGWEELEGLHDRSDFDLRQHQEFSGKKLHYQDPITNEKYLPYVIETSAGLTRSVLITLMDAYEEQTLTMNEDGTIGDHRVVMHFHPNIAPIMAGIFPLMKKEGLDTIAQELTQELRDVFNVEYDASGAIGRRYRRMDEIGTPYCITVDHQTKEDNTVTLRFRDSMEQVRISKNDLVHHILKFNREYQRKP
ncbi:glycine--tRNA ligase [Entomospira culicis]|uniref:Glycine--tRNA ligase n=1 Tax=Entomospira culicis TaxID=2719989 RepID=A0A968GHR4_9SPIO|nr:glycine--tRNA ligase [Entomospira culicis]NIZ18650.1 glycine--tRNA ligase [Entomospira culicis]NIZ68865.1 glycine--tRNA ligase [Entomospira culicis]WDI37953.1 glycine--tRNA ligase [Entomospira culicis]WDI39578.1 glycine--tRNA ligase [Entomospira culicis]